MTAITSTSGSQNPANPQAGVNSTDPKPAAVNEAALKILPTQGVVIPKRTFSSQAMVLTGHEESSSFVMAIEEDAIMALEREGHKTNPVMETNKSAFKGLVSGASGTMITQPFDKRQQLLATRGPNDPVPTVRECLKGYMKSVQVAMPTRAVSNLFFMAMIPGYTKVVRSVTDSPLAEKTVPVFLASVTDTAATAPIHKVLYEMRADHNANFTGVVKDIAKNQGAKGFYSGTTCFAALGAFSSVGYFGLQKEIKSLLEEGNPNVSTLQSIANGIVSGGAASAALSGVMHPGYVVAINKRGQKIGTDNPPKSFFNTATDLVKQGFNEAGSVSGVVRKVYAGYGTSFLRNVVSGCNTALVMVAVDELYKFSQTMEPTNTPLENIYNGDTKENMSI
jgi:hypothetical protein